MSKTKTKAIVNIGYTRYVIDIDVAVQLVEILGNAELYREEWRSAEDGGTVYNVWAQDPKKMNELTITPLSHTSYEMYKLAGQPEGK